ncbi:MAG TPA: 4'-phosphopantetheinyl transferase superfamily protein [Lichenihabitans sp.]|nr:4'-phosphopantetheinyl transferase superfamily protein [Lichenihabitans sp.]
MSPIGDGTARTGSSLDEGRVIVRLLDPDGVTAERLAAWTDRLLTAEERRRAEAFGLPRLRHEHLCTRVVQRLSLSRLTGADPADWRFVAPRGQRPEICAPATFRSVRFSLSHTRGLIACAASTGPDLGVDVEHLDSAGDVEAVAARFFARPEAATILDTAPESRRRLFLQHWTLKEACYKALGSGLALPMDALRVETLGAQGIKVAFGPEIGSDPDQWQFHCGAPTSCHVLALAIRKGPRQDLAVATDWFTEL